MPVPSTVHAKEIERVAAESYVAQQFGVALIDAPGTDFGSNDAFASVMNGEVQENLGGYERQFISFTSADVGAYESGVLPLARKAATFEHNGAEGQSIRFSHVVLINPQGNEVVSVSKLAARATLTDGQTAVFYFDFSLYGVFVAS